MSFLYEGLKTPFILCDEGKLVQNLDVISKVRNRTGCKVLLALKGFALHASFPLIRRYLDGVCASSPHEARLGFEEFKGEVHVYAPAYSDEDIKAIKSMADHISFNSFAQWKRFRDDVSQNMACGLRVNPGYSEVSTPLYDPCAPGSRLGVSREAFEDESLDGLSGLHFHALCEQGADVAERVLAAFEKRFGHFLKDMEWFNMGGGHHISRADYDIDLLCRLVDHVTKTYGVQVYLEPGEAIALGAGVLVSSVLDIVENETNMAILDTSASAHMPDVLEMPYRPEVQGAGLPGEKAHTYQLGGLTCLAGDVIGDYSFDKPLEIGDKLVFEDMAHYTMVKNTTFNGVQLPSIAVLREGDKVPTLVKEFAYEDYKGRLS